MTAPSQLGRTEAVPRRHWWLVRGTAAVVVALGALGVVRVWWGHVAQARLAAEFAAAHARGEPATFEDFTDRDYDPEDAANAAVVIARAEGRLTSTQAQQDWDNGWLPGAAPTPADRTMLRSIVSDNAAPLALLRHAADVPAVNWGVRLKRPLAGSMFPNLGRRREAGNLLRKSFAIAHDDGDDATAIADVRAIVRLADATELDTPFLVTHLVAIGIQAMGTETVERSAGTLRVEGGPARSAAEALLRQLCDESALRAGGRRQWYGERLFIVDMADDPAQLGIVPSPTTAMVWPLGPMLLIDAAHAYRAESDLAAGMDGGQWPAVRGRIPARGFAAGSPLDATTAILRQISMPSFDRAVQLHFTSLADRRMAAVLLALRLYAADHGGRLPGDITELVPAYMASVPIDPMSPDGHGLRYVAAAGREAVYSVGEDGVDDGGSTVPMAGTGRTLRGDRWHQADAVCPYHAPPPATQPGA